MNALKAALFENPLWILAALAIAEIVLVAVWRERRTRKFAWALVGPPILAGMVAMLAWVVVTDREQILAISRTIAREVAADNADVVETYLDENFIGIYRSVRLDRAAAAAACRREVRRYRISDIRLANPDIEVRGESAEMHVTATMSFSDAQAGARRIPVHFRIEWINGPDGWRISGADDIRIGLK